MNIKKEKFPNFYLIDFFNKNKITIINKSEFTEEGGAVTSIYFKKGLHNGFVYLKILGNFFKFKINWNNVNEEFECDDILKVISILNKIFLGRIL